MIANMNSEVIYLSPTYPGSVHDKSICDNEELEFLKKVSVFVDLGFLGFISEKANVIIPFKHKKKHELTNEQKKYNKWVSKIRVKIEHVIASVKIFRKVKEKFRSRLYTREDTIMLVACALHNLKLRVKQNT